MDQCVSMKLTLTVEINLTLKVPIPVQNPFSKHPKRFCLIPGTLIYTVSVVEPLKNTRASFCFARDDDDDDDL